VQKSVVIAAPRRAFAGAVGTFSGEASHPPSVRASSAFAPGVSHGASSGSRCAMRSSRLKAMPSAASANRFSFGTMPW